jgi:hypothetical protein
VFTPLPRLIVELCLVTALYIGILLIIKGQRRFFLDLIHQLFSRVDRGTEWKPEYAKQDAVEKVMRNGKLHVGEWVEVRSKEEILKTLDRKGQLNGLPFMPQMFEFCGRRLRVYKRAHKTCDTVKTYKGRWMDSAVHLEGIRCDRQAYGGCQAACLIYWKEAWLKRAAEPYLPDSSSSKAPRELGSTSGITQEDVWAGTKAAFNENPNDPVYVCQATQVPAATQPLPWWDIRQYIEDGTSGGSPGWLEVFSTWASDVWQAPESV